MSAVESGGLTPDLPGDREFSVRAVLTGVTLGIVFAVASLYLVSRFGITASASIPVAVLSIAGFSLSHRLARTAAGTTKEFTTIQTIGSVGESLAFTVGLAVPIFELLGAPPLSTWQVFLVTCGGGLFGCLALVPYWRNVRDGVFPEGEACARVIQAATNRARDVVRPLLQGAAAAATYAVVRPLTALRDVKLPFALELSPELLGIGYMIETRAALTLGCGGLASWLLFDSHTMPKKWIAQDAFPFVATGAIATSAAIQLFRRWRLPAPAARTSVALDPRTADLHPRFIWIVAAASLVLAFVTVAFPLDMPTMWLLPLFVVTAILSVVFARFSASVAGKIGSSANPISATAVISAVVAAAVAVMLSEGGPKDTAVLTVALIVAMAATCAGMTAQVFKTGELLGANRRLQETGVIIGTITSSIVLALALPYLSQWMVTPGPPTMLLRDVIRRSTSGEIQWLYVAAGAVLTIALDRLRISSFIFAVGMYLKTPSALPIALGGVIYWLTERWVTGAPEEEHEEKQQAFSLFASGIIAGGVIASVLVVIARGPGKSWEDSVLTLALFAALGALFVRLPRR